MYENPIMAVGRTGRIIRGSIWFLFVVFLALVGIPFVVDSDVLAYGGTQRRGGGFWWIGQLWMGGMIAFLALWIFFLGSCLASFLNVVAWRLPRKKSLLGKSQCPNCGESLSLRENMPIVGWLQREGVSKCCGLPIPSRYFWVEVLLGITFLFFGALEVGLLGVNLPSWLQRPLTNHAQIDMQMLVALGGHLALLSLMFTISLFRFEGDRIPASVFLFGIVLFVLQHALISNASWFGGNAAPRSVPGGLLSIRFGLAIAGGALLAAISTLVERAWLMPGSFVAFRELFFGLSLVGLLVEIDAMIFVFALTLLMSLGLLIFRQFGDGTGWLAASQRLFVSTLLQLTAWRFLTLGNLSQRLWDWIAT